MSERAGRRLNPNDGNERRARGDAQRLETRTYEKRWGIDERIRGRGLEKYGFCQESDASLIWSQETQVFMALPGPENDSGKIFWAADQRGV